MPSLRPRVAEGKKKKHGFPPERWLTVSALDAIHYPWFKAGMISRRQVGRTSWAGLMSAASLCLALPGFGQAATGNSPAPRPTLKSVFRDSFHLGVAINGAQFTGSDQTGQALILREFDSVSPENALKWDAVQPTQGQFRFGRADAYVEFGVRHGLWTIGHALLWHSQLPNWVSKPEAGQSTLSREELLTRLRAHITTVVGRYRGRIQGWDVINEVVEDRGGYRQSLFYRVLGREGYVQAFKWAHEADPAAELYYNDYNLEADDPKRATALDLVRYLREQGAPINGVGLQGHYNLTYPSPAKIDETIGLFAALGVKVMITELDVEVNRAPDATITGAVGARADGASPASPLTPAELAAQAKRYADIFAVLLKNKAAVTRVTLWGLRDTDSWRQSSSPLIFNDAYAPKPAYDAILRVAQSDAPQK
jgi:endo-1,4-beta-xylanase